MFAWPKGLLCLFVMCCLNVACSLHRVSLAEGPLHVCHVLLHQFCLAEGPLCLFVCLASALRCDDVVVG